MKILVTSDMPRAPFSGLPPDWEVRFPEGTAFSREELISLLPEQDVLLSMFNMVIDRGIIDAGKRLRLISNYGVGFNNIDIAYARSRGIAVTNTPEAVNNPTAELTLALMLAAARRIGECDRRIRTEKEGMWGAMRNLGCGLQGKLLGIVGLGKIGQNVARKAEAFGMDVAYYNPHTHVPGYRRMELDSLLSAADFISLHTPLTPSTDHLIGEREFALMKPSAIVVNTSRGRVIDEKALCRALETGQIAGAALDVFEDEPHVTQDLYGLDNVVLVPHIGTATIDARTEMGREALENIRKFFSGSPVNVVN